jgi:hypothetical protein
MYTHALAVSLAASLSLSLFFTVCAPERFMGPDAPALVSGQKVVQRVHASQQQRRTVEVFIRVHSGLNSTGQRDGHAPFTHPAR